MDPKNSKMTQQILGFTVRYLVLAVVVPLNGGVLDCLAPAHGAGQVDALPKVRNQLPATQNRF